MTMTACGPVKGIWQLARSAQVYKASVTISAQGMVQIHSEDDGSLLQETPFAAVSYGDVIPGLPVDLVFADSSRFIPLDSRFRWPGMSARRTLPAWLEEHWLALFAAVLLVPAFVWLMVTRVVPAGADLAAVWLPDSVGEELGQQSLTLLDASYMAPSALTGEQQQPIRQRWQQLLAQLQLNSDDYPLHFRRWNYGANAMALADGTIILTDDIVQLMARHPQQLDAVLLHELGHVEHKHGLKTLSRATAMSMLFAMIFGDIEGAGEMVLGLGTSFMQSAFSRDMEHEADHYALLSLQRLQRPGSDFADALLALQSSHEAAVQECRGERSAEEKRAAGLFDYLRTHPDTSERIRIARNFSVPE